MCNRESSHKRREKQRNYLKHNGSWKWEDKNWAKIFASDVSDKRPLLKKIERTLSTQLLEQPHSNMGNRSEQTPYQRRYLDGK